MALPSTPLDGKSKLQTNPKGRKKMNSPKINSQFLSNTWWTFLEMWDQMKITSTLVAQGWPSWLDSDQEWGGSQQNHLDLSWVSYFFTMYFLI